MIEGPLDFGSKPTTHWYVPRVRFRHGSKSSGRDIGNVVKATIPFGRLLRLRLGRSDAAPEAI